MLTPEKIAEMDKIAGLQDFSSSVPQTNGASRLAELKALRKPKEKKYLGRVIEGYKTAAGDIKSGIKEAAGQMQEGHILKGVKTAALRTVGGVAEAAFDPITEVPIVKKGIEKVGEEVKKIPGVEEKIQQLSKIAQDHPEIAKDIKNAVDILALGAGKTVEKPIIDATGKTLEKTGTVIEESGVAAANKQKDTFVRDLIRPEQTKAIKEAQVGRTTEKGKGIFKRSEVAPTKQELASEEAVKEIPNVSSNNTYQQNFNIIKDYNKGKAVELENIVKENDFIIPKKEIKARLQVAKDKLVQAPLITGDAEKTADKLIAKANQLIDANEGKGSGILKARKEYDAWVESQKPNAFDAKAENAFTIANREIRSSFNDLLDEKAPNLEIKKSLQKQSALYNAMENITPKAATEADTAVGRAFQNIAKTLGTKNKVVQIIAAAAGIGGLGAAATFAPGVAVAGGLGFLVYRGGKFLLKPELRIAFGKLLKTAGEKISSEDKAVINSFLDAQQHQ